LHLSWPMPSPLYPLYRPDSFTRSNPPGPATRECAFHCGPVAPHARPSRRPSPIFAFRPRLGYAPLVCLSLCACVPPHHSSTP
jgi:hypothetical protein